jgi:hypothetical protein
MSMTPDEAQSEARREDIDYMLDVFALFRQASEMTSGFALRFL